MTRKYSVVDLSNLTDSYTTDGSFFLGFTKPTMANPASPTSSDNVGAAFGWNGVTLADITFDYVIGPNSTVTNKRFKSYVTFTDSTSVARNCVFESRAPGGTFKQGIITGSNGGTLDRCSIYQTPTSAVWYMNGIYSTGGTWTLNRCHVSKVLDSWHTSFGSIKMYGCDLGPYSFWDTDTDHSSDAFFPYWSHGDNGGQRLNGLVNTDEVIGCNVHSYFDTTDVTYNGTHYVNGANTIGNPAACMNGNKKDTGGSYLGEGSTHRFTLANYANGITYSNTAPYTGMTFNYNWFDGGHYVFGILLTNAGNHSVTIIGNRFGMGGEPWSGNNAYNFVMYPAGTTYTASGNVIDNLLNVPFGLRNTPVTFDSTGARQAA
jgi:hypothetical protein